MLSWFVVFCRETIRIFVRMTENKLYDFSRKLEPNKETSKIGTIEDRIKFDDVCQISGEHNKIVSNQNFKQA